MDHLRAEETQAPAHPVRRADAAPAQDDILKLQQTAGNAAVAARAQQEAEGSPGSRPNLALGDSGPGVLLLQRKLRQLGLGCPADGNFEQTTHDAVVGYQEHHPELLPATGGVGRGTWAAVDRETAPLDQDLMPPSTASPLGVSTSTDPLTQLEIHVLQVTLANRVPWYVVLPVRKILRVLYTLGTAPAILGKLVYDVVHFVESGRWEAEKAKGKSPLAVLLFNSHLSDTLLHIDVITDLLGEDIAAVGALVLSKYPHAGPTFQHYLHGHGADYTYDLQEFADTHNGFHALVRGSTPLDGTTKVITDFEAQTDNGSSDWHYTFGNIDHISLRLIDASDRTKAKVQVVLADPYQWHGDEIRADLFMHKSMEILKQTGAQEFMQRGKADPVTIDLSGRY